MAHNGIFYFVNRLKSLDLGMLSSIFIMHLLGLHDSVVLKSLKTQGRFHVRCLEYERHQEEHGSLHWAESHESDQPLQA